MNKSITQDMAYRQSLMKYAEKYGVSRASRKYNKSRSYIYFWKARWNGTVQSLSCQSRRPHSHPNQHTEAELKLIQDMRRRNPDLGMVELWHRLRKRGYTRRPESLFRLLRKLGLFPTAEKKKAYSPKPYEQMTYPGQRVQVDVKVVPRRCIANPGLRLFQYTAIDEFSRLRFLAAYPEQSTYSSANFLKKLQEWYAPAYGWSASRRTTVLNSPTASPTVSGTCPPCLRLPPPSSASSTSSSVPIRHVTTAKWSAATGRTRNGFIPATAFIPSMTLQSSSPSTTAAPTTFL